MAVIGFSPTPKLFGSRVSELHGKSEPPPTWKAYNTIDGIHMIAPIFRTMNEAGASIRM